MGKKSFKIRALFTETKKKRTVMQEAKSVEELIQILTAKGYVAPFEIEELEPEPPTERQLSYAKDLGIQIPIGISRFQLSILIDRKVNNDSEPNPELVTYAEVMGIDFPDFVGKKALYDLIFANLGLRDKLAFFVFAVYRYLSEDRRSNLQIHPNREKIYDYVDTILLEDKIVKSICKYQGEELRFFGTIRFPDGNETRGGSINTIGYKVVSEWVSMIFNTPKTKIWRPEGELTSRQNSQKDPAVGASPFGCVILSILFCVVIGIVWIAISVF